MLRKFTRAVILLLLFAVAAPQALQLLAQSSGRYYRHRPYRRLSHHRPHRRPYHRPYQRPYRR